MLSVGTVVIGVHDLHRAVAFWTQALKYVPKREVQPDDDFMILVPAAGHGTHLALDVSETIRTLRRTPATDDLRSTGAPPDTPATTSVNESANESRNPSAGSRPSGKAASCATSAKNATGLGSR